MLNHRNQKKSQKMSQQSLKILNLLNLLKSLLTNLRSQKRRSHLNSKSPLLQRIKLKMVNRKLITQVKQFRSPRVPKLTQQPQTKIQNQLTRPSQLKTQSQLKHL